MSADFQLVSDTPSPRPVAERDAAHRAAIDLRRELSAARAEIKRLHEELDEARHLHRAGDEALQAARAEIIATRQVVAKMQSTASWKLTAPLRELDSAMWRVIRTGRGGKK